MIEKESENLHVILHDSPEPLRLLVISKKQLRRFLLLAPTLTVIFAGILVATLWFKSPSTGIKMKMPTIPSAASNEKVVELEAQIKAMTAAQENMQVKLSQTTVNDVDIWLGPVKRPYALQDLTDKSALRLDSIQLEDGEGKRVLRFNLINAGSESERITGHIFVFQIDSRGLSPYPAMTGQEWVDGIRYNKGESFAVSRLRPVEAPFPPADSDARFLVLIFNREGDLLLRKELSGPFKAVGQ